MAKPKQPVADNKPQNFLDKLPLLWLGALGFLIAVCFFLQTYDSAQIKITLLDIGLTCAITFFASKLIITKTNIFNKRNFVVLLPFILYFAYISFSFFFNPYLLGRAEVYIRFLLLSGLFVMVFFDFDEPALKKLLSFIVVSCWVVYAYGILQIINNFLLPGADPLFWTDFFGKRVFSTIANPNFFADFCLFTLMILSVLFIKEKRKSVLLLIILGCINILFTESKGAWLALAVSLVILAFIYLNFFSGVYKKSKLKFNLCAAALVLAAFLLAGYFSAKRFQSVNFRLSTWRATWDMIEAKPVTGTGIGSFSIIYPAYKRPEIFYIENMNNAESQHAENFYLEQWASLGILGFALWMLAAAYLLKGVYSKFKNTDFITKDKEKAFTLLAFFTAAAAVYIHNFVDVSIYFASTSYFLFLALGACANLSYGQPQLSQKQPVDYKPGLLGNIFKFIALAAVLFTAVLFVKDFAVMTDTASESKFLYSVLYWIFFAAVLGFSVYAFFKLIIKYGLKTVCVLVCICCGVSYFFWGYFKANYYFSLGTYLAESGDARAPEYYQKTAQNNPFTVLPHQFKGLFYATRADGAKTYLPQQGDTRPANDFERGLLAFAEAQKRSPNAALLAYNKGTLYNNFALKQAALGDALAAQQMTEEARFLFEKAILLNPVHDNAYYQLANIAMRLNNFPLAEYWLVKYIEGPQGVVNADYLSRHKNDKKALSHLAQVREVIKGGK